MTQNDPKQAKLAPAYVPLKTFKAFIETLSESVVPPRIDRGLLRNMSGVTQSQLLTSLRFLALIDDDNRTQPGLRSLCDAFGTEQWSAAINELILPPYKSITADIHLETDTSSALHTAFRTKGGAEGDTNLKSVRFYLKALEEAGIPYSPHFKARGAASQQAPRRAKASSRKKRQRRKNEDGGANGTNRIETPEAPNGMTLHPIGVGRHIGLESDLTSEDVDVIESMIPAFRKMAERIKKGGAP